MYRQTFIILLFLATPGISIAQTGKGFLRLVHDTLRDEYGYVNTAGDTVVALNKYRVCYTKKFDHFAIVKTKDNKIIGIDRNENVLFDIFIFDNGPDYTAEGLIRIVRNGKIGYADINGHIVIQPAFDGAYPFKNGEAKVGVGCELKAFGEHSSWIGGTWFTINKKGKKVGE